MKISIEFREPDAEGKRALRLTYYAGSYLEPTTGIRKHKRHCAITMTTASLADDVFHYTIIKVG
ncbi:hypothetical protein [Aeromonas veronii]|uniref:hypothetical protein n=1 Tax=Aeromonas TaxID=642 RepID=UPI001D09F78B|nr:hypothetical protein [Aeromonas veronii]UDN22956.1 hypothetical protein LEO77_20990 [Aeromonas veronii]